MDVGLYVESFRFFAKGRVGLGIGLWHRPTTRIRGEDLNRFRFDGFGILNGTFCHATRGGHMGAYPG